MTTSPTPLPPPPTTAPPMVGYAIRGGARDAEHLRLLAIFHYIYGALTMLFSCIFIVHIVIGVLALNDPNFLTPRGPGAPANAQPMPTMVARIFIVMGSAAIVLGWTVGILTIVSGRCIAGRRRRTFSLVMAGINCVSVPLGTTLGVFTFVVLLRDSIRPLYGEPPKGAPAAFPVRGYN